MGAAVERAGIRSAVPHSLKHSSVKTYFKNGDDLADAADYFATTHDALLSAYRQHPPSTDSGTPGS